MHKNCGQGVHKQVDISRKNFKMWITQLFEKNFKKTVDKKKNGCYYMQAVA